MDKIGEVLGFWFGEDYQRDAYNKAGDEPEFRRAWFVKDQEFDAEIGERFADDVERAIRGAYEDWPEAPHGRLALIILLDQFSRNLFRGSPRSWSQDLLAQKLTLDGIERGHDTKLGIMERMFFYLPLEHAEDRHLQALSVQKFGELVELAPALAGGNGSAYDYAVRHKEIIDRFGRFPHRNEVLSRPTTPEEAAFLEQPGSSF